MRVAHKRGLQLTRVVSLVCIALQRICEGLHDMEQRATVVSDYALRFLTAAFSASVIGLDLNK